MLVSPSAWVASVPVRSIIKACILRKAFAVMGKVNNSSLLLLRQAFTVMGGDVYATMVKSITTYLTHLGAGRMHRLLSWTGC
jgi:hypothetical protein